MPVKREVSSSYLFHTISIYNVATNVKEKVGFYGNVAIIGTERGGFSTDKHVG